MGNSPYAQLVVVSAGIISPDETKAMGVPVYYAFLRSKTQKDYEKFFEEIKAKTGLAPRRVACDFEKSIINALKKTWPTTTIHLCAVHWARSYDRNFGKHSLASVCNNSPRINDFLRALRKLPYLSKTKKTNFKTYI